MYLFEIYNTNHVVFYKALPLQGTDDDDEFFFVVWLTDERRLALFPTETIWSCAVVITTTPRRHKDCY